MTFLIRYRSATYAHKYSSRPSENYSERREIEVLGDTANVVSLGGIFSFVSQANDVKVAGFLPSHSAWRSSETKHRNCGLGAGLYPVGHTRHGERCLRQLQSSVRYWPITGKSNFNSGFNFNTVSGNFILNSTSSTSTFTATTNGTPSPSLVPEPSSLAMFGTGILGIAGFVRRKLQLA